MKPLSDKKLAACKKASESLAFACDEVNVYLNEFPNCAYRPALLQLQKDMNDLSFCIERKPLSYKKYSL
jgi:hypothetical protein